MSIIQKKLNLTKKKYKNYKKKYKHNTKKGINKNINIILKKV